MNQQGYEVLVLSYSQTGRTADALQLLLAALQQREDVSLHEVRIEPEAALPYPWPLGQIWSQFPEAVCEVPMRLKTAPLAAEPRYDLVILACQVWFLSCSSPVASFLSGSAAGSLRDTPVVLLLTYRKAWAQGLECVVQQVQRLGGWIAGRIVLRAQDVIPLPALKLMGENRLPPGQKEWRFDPSECRLVEQMGRELADSLPRLHGDSRKHLFDERSTVLRPLPERRPTMTLVEQLIETYESGQKKRYRFWGGFICRHSRPVTARRYALLLLLAPLFLPPIYWVAPAVIARSLVQRLVRRRVAEAV